MIASKLPPARTRRTYFHSGRAAFAYLLENVVPARRVYLPTYTCWSLVSTLERRFPEIEIGFYPVRRDLSCELPRELSRDEALVLIHFFGYTNPTPLPAGSGTVLEDVSHAFLSTISHRGAYVFGSLRKVARVADGGFVDGFFNPMYEPSRKLDTWLRYAASDWRDMREAENMTDREWHMCDMSSQSLAVVMSMDTEYVRQQRQANESYLARHLTAGRPLREFSKIECPLLHQRIFDCSEERDSLRAFLAGQDIFCSIHWPTHPLVKASDADIDDTLWMEQHSLAIPVGGDYSVADMDRIIHAVEAWRHAGS